MFSQMPPHRQDSARPPSRHWQLISDLAEGVAVRCSPLCAPVAVIVAVIAAKNGGDG